MGFLARTSFSVIDLARATILCVALAGSIFLWTNTGYAVPAPKPFSFTETGVIQGGSIDVGKVDGRIFVTGWTQPFLLINGTVSVTGEGANPDNVVLAESSYQGSIFFNPIYNDTTPGRDYVVNVNLYLPLMINFSRITIDGMGLASVQLGQVNSHRIYISTLSGNVDMTIRPMSNGDYEIITYNGGDVSLAVDSTSSFQLDASSDSYGQVTVNGFGTCQTDTLDYTPPPVPSESLTTLTCRDHSAYISVKAQHTGFYSGNITITSV